MFQPGLGCPSALCPISRQAGANAAEADESRSCPCPKGRKWRCGGGASLHDSLGIFSHFPLNTASDEKRGCAAQANNPKETLHRERHRPQDFVPSARAKDIAWGDVLERVVPFAAPLDVRLVGKNVVVLFQILPIALRATIVDLMVQGQVWVKMPDDSVSLKTTVQSLSLPLGSRLYFYPLGVDAKTGAPIAVEIRVDRQPKQ